MFSNNNKNELKLFNNWVQGYWKDYENMSFKNREKNSRTTEIQVLQLLASMLHAAR